MYSPIWWNTRSNYTKVLSTVFVGCNKIDRKYLKKEENKEFFFFTSFFYYFLSIFLHPTKTLCQKHLCFIVPCVWSYRWVHFSRTVLFCQPHQHLFTHSLAAKTLPWVSLKNQVLLLFPTLNQIICFQQKRRMKMNQSEKNNHFQLTVKVAC